MLKSRLYGIDAEGFQSTGILDMEALHEMDARELDREEMETEISTDINTAEEASSTVVEIQDAVEVLAAGVEDMNPVEVGKAIGTIEDKLDTIAENVEEVVADTEALVAGNLAAGIRQELEAISDKLKTAWEAVKNFFRAVWEKIKKLTRDAIIWVMDGTKKAKALLEKINGVSTMKADLDVKSLADKVGSKLNVVLDGGLKGSDIKSVLSTLDVMDPASMKTIQGSLKSVLDSTKMKTDFNITSEHEVFPLRFNGNTIKFSVIARDGTYVGVHTGSYTPAANASVREAIASDIKSGKILATIKELLSNVDGISAAVKSVNAQSVKAVVELTKILDAKAESIAIKQNMFKTIWVNTAGHKSAEQYTADEKIKAIRNMQTYASKGTSDGIFGGLSLIREINALASLVLANADVKKD